MGTKTGLSPDKIEYEYFSCTKCGREIVAKEQLEKIVSGRKRRQLKKKVMRKFHQILANTSKRKKFLKRSG